MKTRKGKHATLEYWYEDRWWTVNELSVRWGLSPSHFYKLGKSYNSFTAHDAKYGVFKYSDNRVNAEARVDTCLEDQGRCRRYEECWLRGCTEIGSVECLGFELDTRTRAHTGKCHGKPARPVQGSSAND